jgi:DNA-binding MarR family transcriptional regulator
MERESIVTTPAALSKIINLPDYTIRRMLKQLETAGLLTLQTTNKSTQITLKSLNDGWKELPHSVTLTQAWRQSVTHKGVLVYLLMAERHGVVNDLIGRILSELRITESELIDILDDLAADELVKHELSDSILTVNLLINEYHAAVKQTSNECKTTVTPIYVLDQEKDLNCDLPQIKALAEKLHHVFKEKRFKTLPEAQTICVEFIRSKMSIEELEDGISFYANNWIAEIFSTKSFCDYFTPRKLEDTPEPVPIKDPLTPIRAFFEAGGDWNVRLGVKMLERNYADGHISGEEYEQILEEFCISSQLNSQNTA